MSRDDRRLLSAALLLVLAIGLYFATRPKARQTGRNERPQSALVSDAEPRQQAPVSSLDQVRSVAPGEALPVKATPANPALQPASTPEPTRAAPAVEAKPDQPQADVDPIQDLEQVQLAVRGFRDVMGENPFGTNAEITKTLMGDNLKQVKMTMPPGSAVNEEGELVDRWGTPYFFHQISGTEMEIRSAGPDRKMWTKDDRQVK